MTAIIIKPFAWLLMTFYSFTLNYGVAVILFAVVLKLILLYPMMRSKYSMMRTSRLTPYMKELEKKHEGNKQKYQEEVAKLYKEEKINPMSGCLWSIIPMVILLMLYSVIRQPFTSMMGLPSEQLDAIKAIIGGMTGVTMPTGSYAELQMAGIVHDNFNLFKGIPNLTDLDFGFLGMDLGKTPSWNFFLDADWSQTSNWLPAVGLFLIPIVSGALSFFSMKISNAANPAAMQQQQSQMKMMMYMMPFVSVYIGFVMPAALGIYWIANSVLAIIQDSILNSYYGKKLDAEDAERRERIRAREIELEKKHLETERLKELGATEKNKNTSKKKIQATAKAASNERLAAERAEEKATRRAALGLSNDTPDSQVGNRRYARGRAYVEDRYSNPEGAEEATKAATALSDIDEAVDNEYIENTKTEIENTETGNEA